MDRLRLESFYKKTAASLYETAKKEKISQKRKEKTSGGFIKMGLFQTVEKPLRPKASEGKIIGKKTVRVVFPVKSNKFQNFFRSFEICLSLSKKPNWTFLTS